MTAIRIRSIEDPFDLPDLMLPALDAITLTDAIGLLPDSFVIESLDLPTLRRVAEGASKAGIAPAAAATILARKFEPRDRKVHGQRISKSDLKELRVAIEKLRDGLEQSPVPALEWPSLLKVFDPAELSSRVGTSMSSLRRYASGARTTPDDVAARLHFLAMILGELKGSYNEVGIRRWFHRRRTLLGDHAPADFLQGEWRPEDPRPLEVLALARSLASSPAT
ncbi:MAG: hypothetical protein ACRDHO_14140 [Actinomycetota bacterium]